MADAPNVDPKVAEADKARDMALKADAKAVDAKVKAEDAQKSSEQRDAEKASAEADRAHAKAAEAEAATVSAEPMTVTEARVHAKVDPEMGAGDHLAQQFSNDPANPKPARADQADPALCTVKLSRVTPDSPVPVYTVCHPDMVGDYLRAGWNQA